MTKLSELVELPKEKELTGEWDCYKNTKNGYNEALSEITKLLDREFDEGKVAKLIHTELTKAIGVYDDYKIAKSILLNLKSCLKGE